jgi:hypothetical protein
VNAQIDTTKQYPYSPSSVLKEGIYLTFDNFIKQNPVSFEKVIVSNSAVDKSTLFTQKSINYIDNYGITKSLDVSTIWGYVLNNGLYVYYNKDFFRISFIGLISHFIATQIVKNYASPMDLYSNFNYPYSSQTYETTNLIQNVIDFKSGRMYPFTPESVLSLISDDAALFNEYNALRKRKKKEMMFFYIRKYDESHPLYLYK